MFGIKVAQLWRKKKLNITNLVYVYASFMHFLKQVSNIFFIL